ncbi:MULTISPECIES: hypothetical protein [Pseudomonas]|uniref:Uncharacterized protein n=1 Tax=Pseudomonas moraviensis R28-S TaxID=1395516 RepID=V8R4K1_9PSED|nr:MULTISPECIES: hypothetical protein [Pseudomonas]ETF06852.1 hypothetical protein PMO01_18560 [Pseudomonas moraviensis R28-S]WCI65293.1 hypothetical protein PMJ94_11380 [Pseudomonas aeruginosa]
MKDILENLLCDVTENLEKHFETEEVSTDTLRLHLNYSLIHTLIRMEESNQEFFIDDEVFEFIESEFGIDLEAQWPEINKSSNLTITECFQEQFSMDLFFASLKAVDSDYEYPVEHCVSHIIMRPNDGCGWESLFDDDYIMCVYDSAIHQCWAWMIYDDSKIAEIELFAANLVTLEG